jgi:hypothetical protein
MNSGYVNWLLSSLRRSNITSQTQVDKNPQKLILYVRDLRVKQNLPFQVE